MTAKTGHFPSPPGHVITSQYGSYPCPHIDITMTFFLRRIFIYMRTSNCTQAKVTFLILHNFAAFLPLFSLN